MTATSPIIAASPAPITPMFSFSYMFVRLYSRLADNEHVVSGSMHPDGTKITLQVVSRRGALYEGSFTEPEVDALRSAVHGSLSWLTFFELLQKSFAEHTVEFDPKQQELSITFRHERQSDVVPIPPFTSSVAVKLQHVPNPTREDYSELCEAMISFCLLRSGEKREQQRMDDIGQIEATSRREAALLADEVAAMQLAAAQYERDEAAANSRIKELEAMLSNGPLSSSWREQLKQEDLSRIICRVEDPLHGRADELVGRMDRKMLGLLKSKYSNAVWEERGEAPSLTSTHRGNSLVHPLPAVDLDRVLKATNDEVAKSVFLQTIGRMDDWDFNAIEVEQHCKSIYGPTDYPGALTFLGYTLFYRCGLAYAFSVDEKCLLRWLRAMQAGYRQVPFHNSMHAADVLQCVYYMLYPCEGVHKIKVTDSDVLSVIIAAIVHDFDHPGLNNNFHKHAQSFLAELYGDESVLENAHVAGAFELMKLPQYNLLDGLTPAKRDAIHSMVSSLVLATDMARHAAILTDFRQRVLDGCDFTAPADVQLVLSIFLKAADICNCAKPRSQCLDWAQRIALEYAVQGELDRRLGCPVGPHMGYQSAGDNAALQINFINYAAIPLFSFVSEVLPKMRLSGEHIANNKTYWAARANSNPTPNGPT